MKLELRTVVGHHGSWDYNLVLKNNLCVLLTAAHSCYWHFDYCPSKRCAFKGCGHPLKDVRSLKSFPLSRAVCKQDCCKRAKSKQDVRPVCSKHTHDEGGTRDLSVAARIMLTGPCLGCPAMQRCKAFFEYVLRGLMYLVRLCFRFVPLAEYLGRALAKVQLSWASPSDWGFWENGRWKRSSTNWSLTQVLSLLVLWLKPNYFHLEAPIGWPPQWVCGEFLARLAVRI